MEPTLEPVMEPTSVPGTITGKAIIDNLLCRIAEKLGKSCDLRAMDSYSGYAARVTIALQLLDV